jgi:hypothetical protein
MGGRCLTVIVTGSNYLGGSNGEETQRIGTSGADCGGSRSVFDQRAVREAGDFARVCGDHWLPSKVGDPHPRSQFARDIARARCRGGRLAHRPVVDGERVSGVYRRNVLLTSGRFAMLDDGVGFSLVPWKPAIEQRLGQTMMAVVRRSGVSWEFGRQLGRNV